MPLWLRLNRRASCPATGATSSVTPARVRAVQKSSRPSARSRVRRPAVRIEPVRWPPPPHPSQSAQQAIRQRRDHLADVPRQPWYRSSFTPDRARARISAKLNLLFMAGACLLVIVIVVARPLRRGRGDVNRGRRFSSPFCTRPRRRVRRIPHGCNRSRSTATCARRVH